MLANVRRYDAQHHKNERQKMNQETIGNIVLSVVGIIIGLVATYSLIKKAQSPREHAFMVKAGIVAWVLITACLVYMQLLGKAYAAWLALVYVVGLIAGLRFVFRKQRQIRSEESRSSA